MTALLGPFAVACVVLGAGGAAKLISPQPARQAVRQLLAAAHRSPVMPALAIRALGAAELTLAVAALWLGGVVLTSLVALAFLAFAGFVALMLRYASGTSCGCFGAADTPPSVVHVVANLVLAACSAGAIGAPGFVGALDDQPWTGIPLLGLVAVGVYLVLVVFVTLPQLKPQTQPNATAFAFNAEAGRQ